MRLKMILEFANEDIIFKTKSDTSENLLNQLQR
jgi:hypothetical protein